jgi:hypothetical protein
VSDEPDRIRYRPLEVIGGSAETRGDREDYHTPIRVVNFFDFNAKAELSKDGNGSIDRISEHIAAHDRAR